MDSYRAVGIPLALGGRRRDGMLGTPAAGWFARLLSRGWGNSEHNVGL